MELKQLPDDLLIILSQWLDASDLLSLIGAETAFKQLLNYQPLWLLQAKRCGIYRPEFDGLDCDAIRVKLVAYMRSVYRQIRGICPIQYARLLTNIVIEDDAHELELHILPTAKKSVTALLPIAMQFGRVRIMHSIFTHFNVQGSFNWLIMAIHHECYAAVKYLVEILKVPLFTDQSYQLFPTIERRWDPSFVIVDESGRRHHTTFMHYNDLLLYEIIRCRHPKMIIYLKEKLDELRFGQDLEHANRYLYLKMRRHSLEHLVVEDRCDSPDLEDLQRLALP